MTNIIEIVFPDGKVHSFRSGITGLDIAKHSDDSLMDKILAIKVDNEVWDISRPIYKSGNIKLLTWEDSEGKTTFWHSSAHLLAEALESLYPGVQFGVGPAIDMGFYYDVDFGNYRVTGDDLPKIELEMLKLAKNKSSYLRKEVSKNEAISFFKKKGDKYKLELIDGLKENEITFYEQGNFIDLCRGPHIPYTTLIKAVKLTNVAGAYWRGNEKNKMLTRIYGVSFPNTKELSIYLSRLELAKERDHRTLGKKLELFTFSKNVGLGLPLWLPKGALLREKLEKFLQNAQIEAGYSPVVTPHIGHKNLYITSGHYEKYVKDSFQPIHTPVEDEEFLLKPMNCPHHCEIYKAKPRSYKELPLRLSEFGTVYRYEQSGELHGLTRVRGFTQDDAHIFCSQDQLKKEFKKVIDLVLYIFETLGFKEFTAQISLRDPQNKEKYIGEDSLWEKAEQEIVEVARERKLTTNIKQGEAAFYGPKLDFIVKDILGRSWQLGTIQIDYHLPQRFQLQYTGPDNQKYQPIMIHRAPFGSLERFIAILIEHSSGNFPLWLAPIQFIVLPISNKFHTYTQTIQRTLQHHKIHGDIDIRDEKIGKKIRDAELQKIPYMLVVGEREETNNTISIRKKGKNILNNMNIETFISYFNTQSQFVSYEKYIQNTI